VANNFIKMQYERVREIAVAHVGMEVVNKDLAIAL